MGETEAGGRRRDGHLVVYLASTAPEPVTIKAFCQALGQAMDRPCWTAVPGPVVRLLAGEMANEVLLAGQRVIPKRLM